MKLFNVLYLSLAFCLLVLLGCSKSNSRASATGSSANVNTSEAVVGVLVMEERGGKTLLDAWFARAVDLQLPNATMALLNDEICDIQYRSAPFNQARVSQEANTVFDWQHSIAVGDSIELSSRGGVYATLLKQQYAQMVSYTMEQRWLSDALPEDLTLQFREQRGEVENVSAISITPLVSLVLLSPQTGVLNTADETIRWEPSTDTDDIIRLTLSVYRSDESELMDISCLLQDDGAFSLPEAYRASLSIAETDVVFFLSRERVVHYDSGNTVLAVTQVSYPSS